MATPPTATKVPGKRRWLRWLVYAPGIALALILASGLLFRHEAAGWLARSYLEQEGVAVASLRVSALTNDTVELSDLILGDKEEASVRRLRLVFALDIFSATPERVDIEGLKLRLDLTGKGPPLGSLQPVIDKIRQDRTELDRAEQASTEDMPPDFQLSGLPVLHVSNTEIIAETEAGPMAIALDGEIQPDAENAVTGLLSARADSPLGRLSADIEGRLAPDGVLVLDARINEGRIDWRWIAVAQLSGSLALHLSPDTEPQLDANLSFADFAYRPDDAQGLTFTGGQVTAGGALSDFSFLGKLDGPGDSLSLDMKGGLAPAGGPRRSASLSMAAGLRSEGALAAYLSPAGITLERGSATLQAEAKAELPGDAVMPKSLRDLPTLLEGAEVNLQGNVLLAEVALADGSQGISARLPFAATLAGNRLALRLREDGEARVEQPAAQRLLGLGFPSDLLPLVKSGLSISLASRGPRPFGLVISPVWPVENAELAALLSFASEQGLTTSLDFQGTAGLDETGQPSSLAGNLQAKVQAKRAILGEREARGLSVSLPLTLQLSPDGLALTLVGKGKASVQQLGGALPVRLNQPLQLTIEEAEITQDAGDPSYRYRLKSRSEGMDAGLRPPAGDALAVRLGSTALTLRGRFDPANGHDGRLEAKSAGLAIPDYGLTADELSTLTQLGRDLTPTKSSFKASLLTFGIEENWLRPLDINGTLARRGLGYDVTAQAALADGLTLGNVTARYEDAGIALVNLQLEALQFTPDGLQPGDLSPLLLGLEDTAGQLSGEAELHWPPDPAAERGKVEARDLSFRGQGVAVEGLSLDLSLSGLLPLRSAPNQLLTIRRIDSAAAIDDIGLRFQLSQDPSPHLEIAEGAFRLAGADWRIEPTRLGPAVPSNNIVLATENLDLDTFFKLIEIEGLSGSGVLAGRIPITFDDQGVVVANGELKTDVGGRLSLSSETLTSALAGGGETVEMAIRALEDFRYDNLTVSLNKSANNEAQVRLGILGHNPAVLDGQPFQLNINLESNLSSVLEALRQGYSLSDEALRRAWRLRE